MIQVTLHRSRASDVETLAELRAVALRADLTRLGRFEEGRVRQRFRDSFEPAHTWLIRADGAFVGCVALKPREDGYLLEHFYIHPDRQGNGIGSRVLERLLAQEKVRGRKVTLNVLQGSPAKRLYERFGFRVDSEDPIDVFMSAVANQ